jgi:ATP-binding cassette subfamily F protein uup
MIANRLKPDSGNIEYGETVKIGFFSQENEEMDHSLRVIEYIRQTAEYITTKEGKISASQMLETFLFPQACNGLLFQSFQEEKEEAVFA